MNKMVIALMLVSLAVLARPQAWAGEPTGTSAGTDKISIPIKIEPKELRTYDVRVKMTGKMPGEDKQPVDIDANYSMTIQHQYGRVEPDGLLPLEISASKAEATIAGQKLTLLGADFPKITLLLDTSYNIVNAFGLPDAKSGNQMLGLNYGNLIALFFIPDSRQPHAIGESWKAKVRLPGLKDPVDVVTTLKSANEQDGVKTATVHQVWGWYEQKTQDSSSVYNQFTVDSTFALDTGRLLKSHADTMVYTKNPAVYKQDQQPYTVNTKIDIMPAAK